MNKPITVKAHLSLEAIETRYRKAKDPVERSHWQIVWLLAQGKTTKEIAEVTGYCLTWIRALAHRYNDEGPRGLGDRRHGNPGGICLLSQEQQAQLQQALEEPPADGGLWTGPKVARWIESHTGRTVHPQRGWEYLKRLNYSKRVLRPRHAKADPAPGLGAQRVPAACGRPASLPMALRLQFCATSYRTDGVVALADSAGGCVHDCVGAVRPGRRRRPYEADPAGP